MTKRFLSPIKLANIASDPTGATGALYYNSGSNVLKYYNGSAWVTLSASSNTALFWVYLATGGETTLSGLDTLSQTLVYTAGAEQVFLNGVLLVRGQDYTATNGTSIVLSIALNSGDYVEVVAMVAISLAAAGYAPIASPTFTGTITLPLVTAGYVTTTSGGVISSVATIPNSGLTNSSITINGTPVSLGGSITVSASGGGTTTNPLTIGTGLSGTSFNGSTAVTIANTGVLSINGNSGVITNIATAGANSNITSLTGLTTPLSTSQGGTGTSTSLNPAGIVFGDSSGNHISTSSGTAGQFLMSYGGIANGGPQFVSIAAQESVVVATTTSISGTYANNTPGTTPSTITFATGVLTIDGYATVLGDRVLIKDQSAASTPTYVANGIYVVTTEGAIGIAAVLTRDNDADTIAKISAMPVSVDKGSTNGGGVWFNSNKATDSIGTTPIYYYKNLDSSSTVVNGTTIPLSSNLVTSTDASLLIPTQTANSGKYLTTNGTSLSWGTVAGGGFTGGTLTSNLTLATGTSTLAPLTVPSGPILTTPSAGVFENDGVTHYFTPTVTSGRGIVPGILYGSNGIYNAPILSATTAQPLFGAQTSGTGTLGTPTGTGPWTVVITGMTATGGFIVGKTITATAGTGSFNTNTVTIVSVDSATQITVSATGGTIPTAGTVTAVKVGTTGALTLPASTVYSFEALLKWTITTTGGTVSFSLVGGGNATFQTTGVWFNSIASDATSPTTATTRGNYYTAATGGVVTNTLTGTNPIVLIKGTFATNASGTIIPTFTWAGTLPGISTLTAGSYIMITPIATVGTNIRSGSWA